LDVSTKRRTPLSSKKAMPKPSLCSSARVAKPVKLNITSVGVLAFMPRSWHMAATGRSMRADSLQYGRGGRAWPSAPFRPAQEKTPHRGVGAEADGTLARRLRRRGIAGGGGEVRERGPVR